MANVSSNQSWFNSEFANELRQLFYDQFGRSTAVFNFLTSRLKPQIAAGGQGFAPAALNAMRAQATDSIAGQFQHAQAALNERQAQTGGENLPSGVDAQLAAGLYAKEAEAQAGAQNDITLQNEQQRQQNYWRAVGTLSGEQASQNPLGYANAALGESQAVGENANAATRANESGFGSEFGKAFAGDLAKGASSLIFGA